MTINMLNENCAINIEAHTMLRSIKWLYEMAYNILKWEKYQFFIANETKESE